MQSSDGSQQEFLIYSNTDGDALPYIGMNIDGEDVTIDFSHSAMLGMHFADGRSLALKTTGIDMYEPDCTAVLSFSSRDLTEALAPLSEALRRRHIPTSHPMKREPILFEYQFAVTNQCYDAYPGASPTVFIDNNEQCSIAQDANDPRFYSAYCAYTPLEDVIKNCKDAVPDFLNKLGSLAGLFKPTDKSADSVLKETLKILAAPETQLYMTAMAVVLLPQVVGTAVAVARAYEYITLVQKALPYVDLIGKSLTTA